MKVSVLSAVAALSVGLLASVFPAYAAPSGEEQARMYFEFGALREAARFDEAEQFARRTLEIMRNSNGDTRTAVASWTHNLALVIHEQGRYAEAERLYLDALARIRAFWQGDHAMMSTYLDSLARLYIDLTRYREAESLIRRALKLRREGIGQGADRAEVAGSLNLLGIVLREAGQLDAAEAAHKESLEIRQDLWGPLQDDVAIAMGNLALVYQEQGQYVRALLQQKRTLSVRIKLHGEKHQETADSYAAMGALMYDMGRFQEAEEWHQKALEIRRAANGANHPKTADSMNSLGQTLSARGQFAEAGALIRDAANVYEAVFDSNHLSLASSYNGLANILEDHKQYLEASELYEKSLSIIREVLGDNHVRVAQRLHNLALINERLNRPDEAERLYRQALQISESRLGNEHPDLIISLSNLAMLYDQENRKEDAEQLWRRVQTIQEKHLEPDHVSVGTTLGERARGMYLRREFDAALPLVSRAIEILEASGVSPRRIAVEYALKADVLWATGERQRAIEALETAMDLAEQQRIASSGTEFEQAELFSRMLGYFEKMADWEIERGNINAAFLAAERARGRTLLDQFQQRGADPFAGIPEDVATKLASTQQNAFTRVASYEKQLRLLLKQSEIASAQRSAERIRLVQNLDKARQDVIEARRAIRDARPLSRSLLAGEYKPVTLQELQDWSSAMSITTLRYFVTTKRCIVFITQPNAEASQFEITVNSTEAQGLQIGTGSISATGFEALLMSADAGIVKALRQPTVDSADLHRLLHLWRVLIPEPVRTSIDNGMIKRLAVIADGPLAHLPFEALVTSMSSEPVYMLDCDVQLVYSPSATILRRMSDARNKQDHTTRSLLTIGNPASPEDQPTDSGRTRFLYSSLGGQLDPIPYAELESRQAASVFKQAGWTVSNAAGAAATETMFRARSAEFGIIHLACHGFTDETQGNLFGALALAPDDSSDGFLTLGEMSDLSIPHCQLVVLSACETNYGPLQAGEGVWAISRAFLATGAETVAATRWMIDDEASATLIDAMMTTIARSDGAIRPHQALRVAQRFVRAQSKWQHPYYWASYSVLGSP
ncbi:tetratricopeptide repeat protein [bacterium]|nr:tetratricopeptide repeat protein [bacterium]